MFLLVGLDEGWNSNNPPGSFDRGVSMPPCYLPMYSPRICFEFGMGGGGGGGVSKLILICCANFSSVTQ